MISQKINNVILIKVELGGIINVLVIQATSQSPIVRDLAIQWLNQVYFWKHLASGIFSLFVTDQPLL
jgi:hypothetical protein